MYFVGIDISKYKHDCFFLNDSGEVIVNDFVFANTHDGFQSFLILLESIDSSQNIKIGFEATGHYTSNLKHVI